MENSMCLRNHSHRIFFVFGNVQIGFFSVPTERAAVTAGDDFRGGCRQQAFLLFRKYTMKIFVNRDIKRFFQAISVVLAAFMLLAEISAWLAYKVFYLWLLLLCLLTTGAIWAVCF